MLSMRQSYRMIPVYTADVSGVCSALYELGGMTVMHASGLLFFDAALCYIADVRKICDGASAKFHYSQHNSFDLFPF